MRGEIHDRTEGLIERFGHAVIHIFPDLARGLPGFSYSVGLQDLGWPEIVLTGIPPAAAQGIVNRVAQILVERGEPPREGEPFADILQGDYLVRLRSLSPAQVEANLWIACDRAADNSREPPAAFQIVYQDLARRWPEDPGYSCPMALLLADSEEGEARH